MNTATVITVTAANDLLDSFVKTISVLDGSYHADLALTSTARAILLGASDESTEVDIYDLAEQVDARLAAFGWNNYSREVARFHLLAALNG
jgi:hypothetical protein